jgi:hypothetical protein
LLGQVERSVAALHGAYMLAGYSEGESRKESWLAFSLSCKTQLRSGGTDMTDEAEQNTQLQVRNLLISARWYQCVDETRRYLAWERSRVGARPTVTGPNYVTSYCHWVWGLLGEQEKEEAIKYGEEEAEKAALQPMQLYKKVHSGSEVSDVELQLYYLGRPLITMFKEGRREDYRKYLVDTRDLRYTIRYAEMIVEQVEMSAAPRIDPETSQPGNMRVERRSTF